MARRLDEICACSKKIWILICLQLRLLIRRLVNFVLYLSTVVFSLANYSDPCFFRFLLFLVLQTFERNLRVWVCCVVGKHLPPKPRNNRNNSDWVKRLKGRRNKQTVAITKPPRRTYSRVEVGTRWRHSSMSMGRNRGSERSEHGPRSDARSRVRRVRWAFALLPPNSMSDTTTAKLNGKVSRSIPTDINIMQVRHQMTSPSETRPLICVTSLGFSAESAAQQKF